MLPENRLSKSIFVLLFMVSCLLIYGCAAQISQKPVSPALKPVINYFVADSISIKSGQSTNLNWDVTNAQVVFIQPDIGNVSSSGSIKISPINNTNYILKAISETGEITATVNITVIATAQSSNCAVSGCDPVSGRNQDISFSWEQLCLCTEYELQIAKYPNFTLLIYDRNNYEPYATTSPGLIYLAGGILECGHTYYIRVRCLATATGQRIRSPWSVLGCITIGSGLPITNPN